jgi:tetratricopeptide (TPR) repeat protein
MEEARNELGKVYLSQEKRQKAIQQFQKALGLNPNFFEAKQNLEQVKSDE